MLPTRTYTTGDYPVQRFLDRRLVVYDIEQEMNITLHHSPILKLKGLDGSGSVEVDAGTTVKALLGRFAIPAGQQRYLLIYANGKKQTLSYTLRDGDAVQLFLPIGGG